MLGIDGAGHCRREQRLSSLAICRWLCNLPILFRFIGGRTRDAMTIHVGRMSVALAASKFRDESRC